MRIPWVAMLALVAVCLFGNLAHGQSASFRSVDTNSDGVLSLDELVARFGRAGAQRLLRQTDRNGDNRITIQELRSPAESPGGQGGDRDDRPGQSASDDRDDRDDRDDNDDNDEDGGDDSDDDDGGDDGDDGDDDD